MVNSGEREPTTRNVDHKRAEEKKPEKKSLEAKRYIQRNGDQHIEKSTINPMTWQSWEVERKREKKTTRFPKGGPGVLSQGSQLAPEKPRLACQSLTKGPWKASKAKIKDGQRAWSWIRWSSQERHQTICSQLRWAAMPLSVDGEYGG